MNFEDLTNEQLRGMDMVKLREVEQDCRREAAMLRMQLQQPPDSRTKRMQLRRGLARVLTYKNQLSSQQQGSRPDAGLAEQEART